MSPELDRLVAEMVRNSADALRTSDSDMLPAIMFSKDVSTTAAVGVVDMRPLTEAARVARETARDMARHVKAYVVAWDGYVTIAEGPRTDAILMEAWESSGNQTFLLAQRYRRHPFELIGDVVDVTDIAS